VRAVEENLTAFHVALSQWPEIRLHRDHDRTWTVSERRFSLCNVVLDAQFDAIDADLQIERALAPYRTTNVNIMWKLGPSTQPADLGDRLAQRGFRGLPPLRGMAASLAALDPISARRPGFELCEVRDEETLELWRQAVDRGFGWPGYGSADLADNLAYFFDAGIERPFVAYLGLSEGAPVASSLVFFGGGVAGIYHVSTAPAYRRRGLGSAITTAALAEAHRRGYSVAILHATAAGYPVYRRLGFDEVCTIAMRLRLDES
jgi:ribosomal protein S18 acetylase RimI-like enzyme